VPEIIYYAAASLDGHIATADGGIAWLAPFEATGEDYGYAAFYASVDALLLGSRTYEQVLTFGEWPYADKPCWVFSRRPLEPARSEVIVTPRTPGEVVAELDARGMRRAWLVGGGQLAAAFRAEALISEYIVAIIPVILGSGISLFGSAGPEQKLGLIEHKSYSNGVVQMRYRVPKDLRGSPQASKVSGSV
jgi:dihydrofolate reductase